MSKVKKQNVQNKRNDDDQDEDTNNFNQKRSLPADFAEDLFHYEMEIESDSVDIEVVNKLLTLYATAIEFYESQKNERYLIFKNKTQKLLMRPNVTRAMNIAVEEQRAKTEPDEEHIKSKKIQNQYQQLDLLDDGNDYNDITKGNEKYNAQNKKGNQQQNQGIKQNGVKNNGIQQINQQLNMEKKQQQLNPQKREEINLNLQYISQQDNKDSIQKMLESHKLEIEYIKNNIKNQLEVQQQLFQRRLEKRKNQKQTKQQIDKNEKSLVYIKPEWAIKPIQEIQQQEQKSEDQNPENVDKNENLDQIDLYEFKSENSNEDVQEEQKNKNFQLIQNNQKQNLQFEKSDVGLFRKEIDLMNLDEEINQENKQQLEEQFQNKPNNNHNLIQMENTFENQNNQIDNLMEQEIQNENQQQIIEEKKIKKKKQKSDLKQGIKQLNQNYVIPF